MLGDYQDEKTDQSPVPEAKQERCDQAKATLIYFLLFREVSLGVKTGSWKSRSLDPGPTCESCA